MAYCQQPVRQVSNSGDKESVFLSHVEEACKQREWRQARGFALETRSEAALTTALSHSLLVRAEADGGQAENDPESADARPSTAAKE